MMKRTESSRPMRGAREVICEYIPELHDRTPSWKIGFFMVNPIGSISGPAGRAVGHDGGMHVIAGEYHAGRNRAIKFRQAYLAR